MMAKEKALLSHSASKYTDRKRYDEDERKKDSPKTFQNRGEETEKIKGRCNFKHILIIFLKKNYFKMSIKSNNHVCRSTKLRRGKKVKSAQASRPKV